MPSSLEQTFATHWKLQARGLPPYVEEYRGIPDRKFRFDFAWLDKRVAVECEGGLYGKGGHNSVEGINRDCEKYNLATLNGWRVLRLTERSLRVDPVGCIDMVRQLLRT